MSVWSARRRLACALGGVALLVAGCSGGGLATQPDGAASPSGPGTMQTADGSTPPPPGTGTTAPEEDRGAGDVGTDAPSAVPAPEQSGDAGTVTPTITSAVEDAGAISVSAGVSGIVEDGGTCTLTAASSDGREVSETVAAFADASSTICEPLVVATDRVGPGPWTVRLEYSSPTHSGTATATEVS